VHGVAELWLAGNLPVASIDEVTALFRRSARALAAAIASPPDVTGAAVGRE
jgi:hypothetical protein